MRFSKAILVATSIIAIGLCTSGCSSSSTSSKSSKSSKSHQQKKRSHILWARIVMMPMELLLPLIQMELGHM